MVEGRYVDAQRGHGRRRSWRSMLGIGLLAVVGLVAVTGCSAEEIAFIDLPDPATEEGSIVESFWRGSWIAAWAVGIFTWGLMLWAFVAYRRRKDDDSVPEQIRYNIPIEFLYTLVPLVMVFGIFAFALRDQSELTKLTDEYDRTVGVVGFRWSWTFNYVEDDAYEVGTPQDFPTLWLPVDEKVRFQLNSPDVVHSFWVPAWLFKLDVVPGQTNEFEVTPNQIGEFAGKCAELCGTDHSRMLFNVKVVTREEYDAHIEELKAAGQEGQLETPRVNEEGDIRSEAITGRQS
jgi:cytochrome c oxidase subunit 2